MSNDIVLTIVSVTFVILLLIAGVVITFFISGKQRIKQQMELTQAKLDFEKELRKVETEVSEHVLSQFGMELHDNIGQLLTAMHIQHENLKLDHPELVNDFKLLSVYLEEVSQQLRLLSRTLNNDYIGHIGLLAAIQLEAERLKTLRRFEIEWEATGSISNLGKNQELMMFRIFQEIVQNTLRHSSAKKLSIKINNQDNGFEIRIRDNGKGFSLAETLESQKASGLRNIMKRARLAGLSCEIESSPGKGCLYILKKITTLD